MVKLRTMPWIQNENGLTLILARDAVFAGPIQGLESLIKDNELHVVTTTQKFPIGSMIWDPSIDAVYRYVEFGNTTAAGDMIQAEGPDGAHDDLNSNGTGSGASQAKGATLISFSDTITLVKDEYAGGFMKIETGTGAGYRYPIKSHDAPASNALFTLWDPGLALAISGATVALIKSRYKEVIQMPTTVTGVLVGAGLGVGADGSFGWVQTRGPAAVLTDGTVVIGQHVRASDGVAGAVEPLDRDGTAEDEAEVGYVMDVGPTTEFSLIFLTLE